MATMDLNLAQQEWQFPWVSSRYQALAAEVRAQQARVGEAAAAAAAVAAAAVAPV